MAEVFTSDNSPTAAEIDSVAADLQESLEIGEEIEAAHNQKLAGKYKSAEELEKAYLELQSKLGEGDKANLKPELEETDSNNEVESTATSDILESLYTEYSSGNQVSDETLQKLSEVDPMDMAKAYVEARIKTGNQGLSESQARAIQDLVGGPNQYNTLVSWASDNWAPEEVAAFDSVVDTGNVGAIQLVLKALYYNYTEVNGVEGQTIQGKGAPRTEVFRSQSELIEAMNDSRYDSDPAYRNDVLRKLDNSEINF